MYLSLYCKGSKRVTPGLRVRGSWRLNRTEIFWPPLLWPSTLCLSRFPDAQPEALGSTLLGAGFLYCILSASSLNPNSSGPQAPSAWCGFPYHIPSITTSPTVTATVTWLLSWLSYIIVQRPLDRPLDLWNRMIDRHPAEITVMQFTGHSLPVHQSMSVSWALPCPISSAKSTRAISFNYWPLECVTSFRCITLEWHFWPGRRSKYNTSSKCVDFIIFVWNYVYFL